MSQAPSSPSVTSSLVIGCCDSLSGLTGNPNTNFDGPKNLFRSSSVAETTFNGSLRAFDFDIASSCLVLPQQGRIACATVDESRLADVSREAAARLS